MKTINKIFFSIDERKTRSRLKLFLKNPIFFSAVANSYLNEKDKTFKETVEQYRCDMPCKKIAGIYKSGKIICVYLFDHTENEMSKEKLLRICKEASKYPKRKYGDFKT